MNQEPSTDYWTTASFIIRGETVDPDVITDQLGITPSKQLRQGEKLRESDRYEPSPFGLWSIKAKNDPDMTLIQQLYELLEILEPKSHKIVRIAEQANVWFQCAIFNIDGVEIPYAVLQRIASLKADIKVNVYPVDHDIWQAYKEVGGK